MFGDALKGVTRLGVNMEMNVSIERAVEIASSIAALDLESEQASLESAHGRILAEDLVSKVDDPRFDNSAMDGWAVIESDCKTLPVTLQIIDTVQAGDESDVKVVSNTACRIMTGAPIPSGADAIVMVEDSKVNEGLVEITGPP